MLMVFQKGHKINLGNRHAKGSKHTDEWKEATRLRMLGNQQGFKKGKPSPRKGKKSSKPAWNKGRRFPEWSGENHPNWIKNRLLVKQRDRRNNPLNKIWRRAVWERDGFRCQIADKECEGRIEAHHILRWKDFPDLRFDINNGITLCHRHHPRKKDEEDRMIPLFRNIIDSTVSHLNL